MPDALPHGTLRELRSMSFGKDYYREHQAAGLDYLGHGRWQEEYGRWFAQSLGLVPRILFLDDRRDRWGRFRPHYPTATWARTLDQFRDALTSPWDAIFLDHDLTHQGPDKGKDEAAVNGRVACEWLVERHAATPVTSRLIIHSTQMSGSAAMQAILAAGGLSAPHIPFESHGVVLRSEVLPAALDLQGKRVLDVGCACGSILRGLRAAGIEAQGIDVSEYMVQLGREKWPDMAACLHVADAVNLHLFEDRTFEGLHSAQVAEHWKPELVPHILRELRRVTRPGGLFFCCLDTEELFVRQGRVLEKEDPTHVCIRPLKWWYGWLAECGWQVCTEEFFPAMLAHSESFLKRYDWDFFVARAKP